MRAVYGLFYRIPRSELETGVEYDDSRNDGFRCRITKTGNHGGYGEGYYGEGVRDVPERQRSCEGSLWPEIQREFGLTEYEYPVKGGERDYRSYTIHKEYQEAAAERFREQGASQAKIDELYGEDTLAATKLVTASGFEQPAPGPKVIQGMSRQDLERLVDEATSSVKLDASPGYPYASTYPTNGDFIKLSKPELVRLTVDRLIALQEIDLLELFSLPAITLVRLGLADPIKVFIKDEPHKPAKIKEGRMRLISSMSIVDQLVERVLFSGMNNEEIRRWSSIPCKPGMSLSDVGLAKIKRYIGKWKRIVSIDVSAWDWAFSGRDYASDFLYRSLATQADEFAMSLMAKRLRVLSLGTFVFESGRVVSQEIPGLMKSGSYLTSSTNSHVAVMLAYKAGAENVMAMGDDVVAELFSGVSFDDVRRYYVETGRKLKVDSNDVVEFCSHVFLDPPRPADLSKMVCKLTSHVNYFDIMNRLSNFRYETRHHPDAKKIFYKVLDTCIREYQDDDDVADMLYSLYSSEEDDQ